MSNAANVYDAIYKGRVGKRDVEALRAAFRCGLLKGYLGIPALEELLGEWETQPDSVVQKLQIAYGLVGFDPLLNADDVLLRQAVESYARHSPPSLFLSAETLGKSTRALEGIIRGERSLGPFVSQVVAEGRRLKQEALDQWREAAKTVQSKLANRSLGSWRSSV